MLQLRYAVFALGFAILLQSCGGDSGTTPTAPTTSTPSTPTPVATSVTLSATSVSLAIGATSQLSATVKDQNGATMAGKAITWGSSDAAIVSVSASGIVTAVSPGTATITAAHLALSATASVIAEDETLPQVTALTYDGYEVTFQPGVLELYGPTVIGIGIADDYELEKIRVSLIHDGAEVELASDILTDGSNVGVYTFTWNTHETTSIGGIDTLAVQVWDTSDNQGIGAQEIVLMHQPEVTVNNVLLQPVNVSFRDQNDIPYSDTITVAASSIDERRWAFMSTDSVKMKWSVQRELLTGTYHYLGEALAAVFSAAAPNAALAYEIDNVIETTTYYYPQFTNSTTTEAAPFHNPGLAVGEINICQWNALYRCSIAPGDALKAFGYYELETTTDLIGYKELPNNLWVTGPYYVWTNEQITSNIQTGTGAVSLGISWSAGSATESLGESEVSLQGTLIDKPTGPGPTRIPGARNDDEHSPF